MKISNEVRQEIKMYQANDFEIDSETPQYVLMRKNEGKAWVHIALLCLMWWTFGIANIIYYFASIKKKKVMK